MALDLVVQKVAPDLRVVSVFVAIAPLHVEAISKKSNDQMICPLIIGYK